MLLNFWSDPT